jgi:hypothetical protein
MKTEKDTDSNAYGFIGISSLAKKYDRTQLEIIELFIDCDYSISRTVEYLERIRIVAA